MPKASTTTKNRATRVAANARPAIAPRTRASQRLASKNGSTDTTDSSSSSTLDNPNAEVQPTTTGTTASRAKPARQTRSRAKINNNPKVETNEPAATADNAVEESSPVLNCHPVRNPPEAPPIKVTKSRAAATQPRGKKQTRTNTKPTATIKAPIVEAAVKIKATKRAVKTKTVAAPPAASTTDVADRLKKERELRALRRAAAKAPEDLAAIANDGTSDQAPSDLRMAPTPNAEPIVEPKTEASDDGQHDEIVQSTAEPAVQPPTEPKAEEEGPKLELEMQDEDKSGPTDGDQAEDEQNLQDGEDIVQGGEPEVEVRQPPSEEAEAEIKQSQEEGPAVEANRPQGEEAEADIEQPQDEGFEVEVKHRQSEETEDKVEQPLGEEPEVHIEQPQGAEPKVKGQQQLEEPDVEEEQQLVESDVEEQKEQQLEKPEVEEEKKKQAEEQAVEELEQNEDSKVEEENQSDGDADADEAYSYNPLKRRRLYDDSDEEDLHEEEEVLRLSAYTGMDDSDDEDLAKPDVGFVVAEDTQIPESISAFGKKRKVVYKKRKLNHKDEGESASSDEDTPVESASRVEANHKVPNESDRDQASVVVNAPLSRVNSIETDAGEVLNALLAADTNDDDDEVDGDLEYPASPSAPSTSQAATQGLSVACESTPQPAASTSSTSASKSPSDGSSPIYLGRRHPTQDSPRRVIIRNIPRPTAEPVDRPKMPSYTVLEVYPAKPPPPAGFYRSR